MNEPISFIAQIDTIRTTKDGGFKITLEVGMDANEAMKALLDAKIEPNLLLGVAMTRVESEFKTTSF